MTEPLLTIVTVTFNAAAVIAPTLQSVKEQTCGDFEYLVVDGASGDGTLQLVEAAGIPATRVISEPDKGLYDAMNKAIDHAAGRYLVWMNAGDAFAAPDSLARIAAHVAGNPGVIYGQTQLVDERRAVVGNRHLTAPKSLSWKSFKRGMLVCHQAFVARRDLMPHYSMDYPVSADFDWCVAVLKKSERNAYVGDAPIVNFLIDGVSARRRKASLKERFHIMCKYYGTVPTVLRHVSFVPRFLLRKLRGGSNS